MNADEVISEHIKNSIHVDASGKTYMRHECLIELPNGMMMPADEPTRDVMKHLTGPKRKPGYDLPVYSCKFSNSRLTSGS